jgi:hypothetical protein
MPYCDDCEKYWTPSSMNEDGSCPRCGADLEAPQPSDDGVERERVPWHFKLMIVALVGYLAYRFVELGIGIFI